MSNRIKARLTVLVGLLFVVAWRLAMQQMAVASHIRFPPLVAEQIVAVEQPAVRDCTAALLSIHHEPLIEPPMAQRGSAVLTDDRASRLVRSIATVYYQRDYQTPARVSSTMMVKGEFFGEERLAWVQLWQPPGFDGTYAETPALVIYVDAVAAIPLMIYTDVVVAEDATGCIVPISTRSLLEQFDVSMPLVFGLAVMLLSFGGVLELRRRFVVAVSD